ncbi:MAG: hypothetical protein DYG89_28340 [Caldilinea sp. CFX5]|nr:hypothetical protein [Caldilinea sp. CFX5]
MITQSTMRPFKHLHPLLAGNSRLAPIATGWRLQNSPTTATRYTNAQLDDYQGLPRRRFPWRPPLTLTVRTRFSHPVDQLRGTAGFGFWNNPFGLGMQQWPTLPRAIWFFFSSSPSDMALALDVPGPGWKAATLDAWRWPFFLLAPTAPLAMPLMRIRPLYRRLWPLGQRAIGVHETMLTLDVTQWHTYCLVWGVGEAHFLVDNQLVLHCNQAPGGPLGLVIWKDNQAMTVTPWRLPSHQLVACNEEQWLDVADLSIGT